MKFYSDYAKSDKTSLNTADYMTLNLIIAELHIALGDFDEAKNYLTTNSRLSVGGLAAQQLIQKSLRRITDMKYMDD